MKLKRKRILWLLALVTGVMIGSTWLITANADDTYNFYFQKAPGPVTVNQGSAASSGTPDVKLKGDSAPITASALSPAAAANSVATTPSAEESSSLPRSWEISAGVSGSRSSEGGDPNAWMFYEPHNSGMLNVAQYFVGLQYNVSEVFALQAEAYRLNHVPVQQIFGQNVESIGSPWDGGLTLAITPFRFRVGTGLKITFTALAGYTSVPFTKTGFDNIGNATGDQPEIGHAGSLLYGGRAAIEFSNRMAIQAAVRRIDRFSATQGTASLAILL